MGKKTDKFSLEVRTRAVRMVLEHGGEYRSRWAAVFSVSQKIGCSAHTLNDWVKKAEVDGGRRAGVPSDVAENLRLWSGRTARWQANEIPAKPARFNGGRQDVQERFNIERYLREEQER